MDINNKILEAMMLLNPYGGVEYRIDDKFLLILK